MLVRTLVRGVRSSCDASATSWRWARVDSSSAASIELKLAASRLSSSLPVTSMRSERSCVSLTRSTVVREALHGRERRACDEQAEQGGDDDPSERDENQEEPDAVERRLDLRQRPRDLYRRARARTRT